MTSWLKTGEKLQVTPDQGQGSSNTTLSGQRSPRGCESLSPGERGLRRSSNTGSPWQGYEAHVRRKMYEMCEDTSSKGGSPDFRAQELKTKKNG